jgi:hypothetical protein
VVPLYGSYNINLGSTSGIFTSPIP